VISKTGRNRVFVNDRPITLSSLEDLTRGLVDISGQHEHIALTDPTVQREILDSFGGLLPLCQQVSAAVSTWRAAVQEHRELAARERVRFEREEFLRFALERIRSVDPQPGEEEELNRERARLRHAEKLVSGLTEILATLYHNENSATEIIGRASGTLSALIHFDPGLARLEPELSSVLRQIEDLSRELQNELSGFEADPNRLEQVEERLQTLKSLLRTYGPTLSELLDKQAQMKAELDSLTKLGDRINEVATERDRLQTEALEAARRLSQGRCEAALKLGRRLEEELAKLAMSGAQVKVQVETLADESLEAWGLDQVTVLLSANPGEELRPLAKVASGGELSRVLLGLKLVLAGIDPVATYVFDEVDSGVGGAVAEVIGTMLAAVSAGHQVLCITHLTQIAAYAGTHYYVSKRREGERTVSELIRLTETQRVEEIARMAGGKTISDKARGHARDLLKRATSQRESKL
jgi:DNA repair protein RecN (Recombination protein N)